MNKLLAIAAAASFGVASSASANVVVNGGFELGTGTDSDNWTEFGGGAAGTLSERSSVAPLAGNFSHIITAVGDATVGASAGINYNSISDGGLASLAENTTVTLTFDAETNLGPGGVAFYALRVLDSSGAIVADTGLQGFGTGSITSATLNVPSFGAAPSDAYAAFVEIVVNAGAFDGSTASAKIDNVVVTGTLVPTPASAALLGLGGLAAVRRRR
ncbi:MAG: hypothetical protein RIB60_08440 [Phycisphaerales bacterium]